MATNYLQKEVTFKYKFHKEDHYEIFIKFRFNLAIFFNFHDSRKYNIDQKIKHQILGNTNRNIFKNI